MSTFGIWWCNYTDIKNYKWQKGYYQEKINETEYHLEKCEKDCEELEDSLTRYHKLLDQYKQKSEIAEKKCKLWNDIQNLDKEEKKLN